MLTTLYKMNELSTEKIIYDVNCHTLHKSININKIRSVVLY